MRVAPTYTLAPEMLFREREPNEMTIHLKRAYEDANTQDGYRGLVDRLWPRGVSKEDAALDDWSKDVAPSKDLRTWFDHKETRWDGFQKRYRKELKESDDAQEAIKKLRKKHRDGTLTLVFGAKDTEHNNAVVLKRVLTGH